MAAALFMKQWEKKYIYKKWNKKNPHASGCQGRIQGGGEVAAASFEKQWEKIYI